jgi:hypothetical protein
MNFDQYTSIYVDVDGTLLLWPWRKPGVVPRQGEDGFGLPPTLNTILIETLRKWHRGDRTLVLWSFNGGEHAKMAASLCNLNPDACLPKPRAIVDDTHKWLNSQGKCVHLGPFAP